MLKSIKLSTFFNVSGNGFQNKGALKGFLASICIDLLEENHSDVAKVETKDILLKHNMALADCRDFFRSDLLFGCPTVNFGPLSRGQSH